MLYRLLFKLVLQRMDAERAHTLGRRVLLAVTRIRVARGALRRLLAHPNDVLRIRALGLEFPSPVGLAAGFDKDASCFEGLALLGFGFVEVGTITALGQAGQDRPRVFRLPRDRAIVNRMGFPNPGSESVAAVLSRRTGDTIVGVNIGKTKSAPVDGIVADYQASALRLSPFADYLVLNVSSPNTPGLRDVQAAERLSALISETRDELRAAGRLPPLLVKIGPDLTDQELDAIADVARRLRLDGLIACNTTVGREGLHSDRGLIAAVGEGGVSGAPLKTRSVEVLERLYRRVGDSVLLISVGGVETVDDVWERILAGATLVQAYTAFVYGGPLWPSRLNRGLARRVREAGASSIQELVGTGYQDRQPLPVAAGGNSRR